MQLENETKWRLLDEPFDYSKVAEGPRKLPETPGARVFDSTRPNPENNALSFEYALTRDGDARLEILNDQGRTVEVLADGHGMSGYHMASWNIERRAPGSYAYRFRFGDFIRTELLALLK